MRRYIYLSGPMTNDEGYMKKFINAADQLLEIDPDLIIINPATMLQYSGGIEPGGLEPGVEYRRILEIDKQILSSCDAICLLPGWENSKGCREELETALSEIMDIFVYNDPDLFDKLTGAHEEK